MLRTGSVIIYMTCCYLVRTEVRRSKGEERKRVAIEAEAHCNKQWELEDCIGMHGSEGVNKRELDHEWWNERNMNSASAATQSTLHRS